MRCDDGQITNTRPATILRSSFTLIELLVVIAIVATLMAILLPSLRAARRQAHAAGCQATLRQWGLYYSMYTAANDYKMPVIPATSSSRTYFLPWVLPNALYKDETKGSMDLARYETLLLCPSAAKVSEYSFLGGGRTHSHWTLNLPHGLASSYGQNDWTFVQFRDQMGDTTRQWDSCSVREAAAVPVYSDCRKPFGHPLATDAPPALPDADTNDGTWGMWVYVMDRHHGGINSLFMDWSVRKVGLKELWTLRWDKKFDTAGKWTKAGGVRPEDWPPWMGKLKDY